MAENNTTTNPSYEFTHKNISITIICFLGAISNVLLLVAFIKDPLKCFRNSGTYLVMNLSVSDSLVCLLGPFFLGIGNEILGTVSQSIIECLIFSFGGISFFSITSISIDRFLMVAYPIKHRILIKGKVIILWVAAIWIASCVISSLFQVYIPNNRSIVNVCSIIAILLSAVMYSSTYYKLKKQSRNLAAVNTNESRAQEIRNLKEKRFLNTIIIITCVSVGCVLPSMIFYTSASPKDSITSEVLETTSLSIFYTNFVVNPFIYILRLPNYRKTFFLLYCKRRTASR